MEIETMLSRPTKKRRTALLIVFVSLILATVQCICSVDGACVGSGGSILHSPVCKDEWYAAECRVWDDEGINDANWDFHTLRSCEGLGYTDQCSDGSYRWSGACE